MNKLEEKVVEIKPGSPLDVQPGQLGPGPDELVAMGEIDEPVTQGAFVQLAGLVGKLKARRESLGLSLTDVSERSGLTRQAISRLENGWNNNPTLDTIYRYGLALDALVTLGMVEIDPETGEEIDQEGE